MTSHQTHLSYPKYRPDIDGLRAIAVLSVVAYHAFPSWLTGGFIGVDVFFVISGYLISTIIFENLDKGTFSFSEFYSSRIRRIFPALLLVLIACFAFGWFALLADEYKQLGKHIAAGASFISNFILWNEVGYFDNSAKTKPLLHLWSLGIEVQFYIVWPLLLWFFWKRKFNLLIITVIVALTTFILNLKGVEQDIVATFYSPLTRFWELLSGCLLAWFTLYMKDAFANTKSKIVLLLYRILYSERQEGDGKTLANALSFVGLFLLLYGFLRINNELSFPGNWALMPVLGTLLIITAGSKAWVNRTILSNKVAVWFGLISFPLYLWHWPLLSFVRVVEGEVLSSIRIVAVLLSIVLAWLTYLFVERPLRLGKQSKAKVTALLMLAFTFGYIGFITYSKDGISSRNSIKRFELLNSQFKYNLPLGRPETANIMLIGDSHAAHLATGLKLYLDDLTADYTYPGCIPFFNVDRFDSRFTPETCIKKLAETLSFLEKSKRFKSVIMSSMGPVYLEGTAFNGQGIERVTGLGVNLSNRPDVIDKYKVYEIGMRETLTRMFKANKKVLFVIDVPELGFNPRTCFVTRPIVISSKIRMPCAVARSDYDLRSSKFKDMIYSIAKDFPELIVYDPTNDFCDTNYCYATNDGIPLYNDFDHLNGYGSHFLIQKMTLQLEMLK
jgi:peptidoglycan/LPS O-acetylase OafA/YrhL